MIGITQCIALYINSVVTSILCTHNLIQLINNRMSNYTPFHVSTLQLHYVYTFANYNPPQQSLHPSLNCHIQFCCKFRVLHRRPSWFSAHLAN
jgi:hypothetical protein